MKSDICSLTRDWFRTITPGRLEIDGVLALRLKDVENGYACHVNGVCSAKPQSGNMKDATVMLAAIEAGDSKAAEQLLALVYDELRRLAASKIAWELPGQTLQPTALVHEAWLRLVGDRSPTKRSQA